MTYAVLIVKANIITLDKHMKQKLTNLEGLVFDTITVLAEANDGATPTLSEIQYALSGIHPVKSKNSIAQWIKQLERKGYIKINQYTINILSK